MMASVQFHEGRDREFRRKRKEAARAGSAKDVADVSQRCKDFVPTPVALIRGAHNLRAPPKCQIALESTWWPRRRSLHFVEQQPDCLRPTASFPRNFRCSQSNLLVVKLDRTGWIGGVEMQVMKVCR